MTEAEWLASTEWGTMLKHLGAEASDRKLRLFACACCRRIWDLLPYNANRKLVAAIEDRPNGTFGDPVLKAAIVASSAVERNCGDDKGYWAVKNLGRTFYKLRPLDSPIVAVMVAQRLAREGGDKADELIAQATLFRDVFGNPFRPVVIDAAWLCSNGGAIKSLARSIYDGRTFDQLPNLAGTLEEAGCDNAEMLAHCRSPAPHVRGCWVVDLVLGEVQEGGLAQ